MDKLKQAFGGTKGDHAHTNAATGEDVEHESRSTGILRQVLNPDHNKYEEAIHGTTDTATPDVPNAAALKPSPDIKLQTDPEKERKGSGVLQQILNPGGEKYDEERHGITTLPAEDVGQSGRPGDLETHPEQHHRDTKTHSISRQILNPHGENYSEESHGITAHPVPETSGATTSHTIPESSGVTSSQTVPESTGGTLYRAE